MAKNKREILLKEWGGIEGVEGGGYSFAHCKMQLAQFIE